MLPASCCTQVARPTSVFKLFCARCSVQVSLRKTPGACICAQDAQPELSCGGAPRTIRLRFRVAIFRSEPPGVHSTYYTASFLEPALPRTRGNRTHDRAIAKAGAQTTRQLPKSFSRVMEHGAAARAPPQRVRRDQTESASRHSESASTRSPQRVHPRTAKTQKKTTRDFCTSTTPIQKSIRTIIRVFAPRPRRSPQSVAQGPRESQKRLEFLHHSESASRRTISAEGSPRLKRSRTTTSIPAEGRTSTTPILAEGRAGTESQKTSSFCTSTTSIPAEGRAGTARIAQNL